MTAEWRPPEGFNILDTRNFNDFPQYEIPPYVLKFDFSSPVVLRGVSLDFMGWNIPECRTETLFSKIQISKNGWYDIYYDRSVGHMGMNKNLVLDFIKDMFLSTNDNMFITLFPQCPVHMVDIDRVGFLSIPGPDTIPVNNTTTCSPTCPQQQFPIFFSPERYWYLYATLFFMVILLMLSLLFMTLRPQPTYRLIVNKSL